MATIDTTYFQVPFSIPNTDKPTVISSLSVLIEYYENQLLNLLFGSKMYADYKAGITSSTQIWVDIRDGKAYSVNGKNYVWQGLRVPANKTSIIALYVYYYYLESKASETTGVGEQVNNSEAAEATNPSFKMIKAWNEMVNWKNDLYAFLNANEAIYPDWDGTSTKKQYKNGLDL